jgi:hypothetical protein
MNSLKVLVAKLSLSGFARAYVTNSARDFAGTLGCTHKLNGNWPTIETGAKSASDSKGEVFCSKGIATMEATPQSKV